LCLLGGCNGTSLDIHFGGRDGASLGPDLMEFGDKLRGNDGAILEAVIVQVWRCTWRPYLCKFGQVLVGSRWTSR